MQAINGRKTIGNIIKVSVSNVIKLLSGVLTGFLLPRIIGVTDYGYYKTFTLYATYVTLFAVGITDGIYLKYGGVDYERLDKDELNFISRLYILIEFSFSLLIVLFSAAFLRGESVFIALCVSLFLFSNNVVGYFQIISQITSRFNELSIRNIIQSVVTTVLILSLWFAKKYGSLSISYRIYTCAYIAIFFLMMLWYLFTYRDLVFKKAAKNKASICGILYLIRVGTPLLVANLCSSLILVIDRQFVNVLFDTDTYAVYAFAYNMLSMITTALAGISTVLYPSMKKINQDDLTNKYSTLVGAILAIVFASLLVYFPLCPFVEWFLPDYIESLPVFRVVLPGLAVSSAITIVMHNYYKTAGKEVSFFVKSVIILVLSFLLDYLAFVTFGDTLSLSVASIVAMLVWYVVVDSFFIRKYKVKWIKNYLYLLLMGTSFYCATIIEKWWLSMIVYFVALVALSCVFYGKAIGNFLSRIFRKGAL